MSYIMIIVSILVAYLVGAFPTSFLLTRALAGIDIRTAGSGNAGATNVLRVVGAVPAVITLVVDIAKGVLSATVIPSFFGVFSPEIDPVFYRALLGSAAVTGHIWPLFLKFRGGKGVATALGVALSIAPGAFLGALAAWLVVFALTRYVSLASIIALIVFPVASVAIGSPFFTTFFGAAIAFIVICKHQTNIVRLRKKEEHRTILFKRGKIKASA